MKIGQIVYHPKYGKIVITRKEYKPVGNKVVWYGKTLDGIEIEIDGTETLTPKKIKKNPIKEIANMGKEIKNSLESITAKQGNDKLEKIVELTEKVKTLLETNRDAVKKSNLEVIKIVRGKQGEKGEKGEDGKNGMDGKNGKNGKDGYTPIKGVDYRDGRDGKDGKRGDKPKHKWKGTKLAFEKPIGGWGKYVDLKGERGRDGMEGGGGAHSFRQLNEVPNSFDGQAGKILSIKSDESGVEFIENSGGGGSGHTIQDEGVSLTARTKLNFVGSGVTATDDSGNNATRVTIPETDISGKVDKVTGKGLSTNDYTTAEKDKLSGIAAGAEVNVNADWNAGSGDSQILNKPTIPDELADLTADATHRTVTDAEKSTWNGKQDAGSYEVTTNKKTTLTDNSDTYYPSQKAVKTAVDAKQDSLGYTAENVSNKSTDTSLGSSNTLYPSQNAVKTYTDGLVVGLLDYRGAYDASGNTFPTTGGSGTGGAILKGDMWVISVAGTLGGTAVQVGDSILANVDTPAQTASNWNTLNSNISYVPEDSANKETSALDTSTTKYPCNNVVKTAVDAKVTANAAITGATKTKITYDAKGLVTSGTDATQDDIGDGTTYKQYSNTEKTKLAGIASGAEVNVNADWNAESGDAQILNKPSIPSQYTDEMAQDAVGNAVGTGLDYDDVSGAISVDKTELSLSSSDVGLGNCDNTSDANKPVSTATQTALDAKVDENATITGATKTKITYDAKGLVTAGTDATTADIADSTNKRYVSDAQLTVIGNTSGTNTGDQDLTGYVTKTTYDANTILAATSDNTPVAVTIDEQTVVGRITSGNIVALSVAQLQALLFSSALGSNITLGENYGLVLDAALSADGKYCGIVEGGTAGATLAFGDLCYLNNDDSRWELVDANLSDGYDKKLGICVLAAAADGNATTMLLWGKVRADAAFPTLTVGAPVYVSETAGDVVVAQPTTADVAIRIVGFGNTADELYFNPSNDYIVHT